MPSYSLSIPPREFTCVLAAETQSDGGAPEFTLAAYRDYVIDEDFGRVAYGLAGRGEYTLVTSRAVLEVEARVEQNDWVLAVVMEAVVGSRGLAEENALLGTPMTLGAFDSALAAADPGTISVRLNAPTMLGRKHFDQLWSALSARHRPDAVVRPRVSASAAADRASVAPSPARSLPEAERWRYGIREAVAVFADVPALEAAVDALECAGFDRAQLSVLGGSGAAIRRLYRDVASLEDDPAAPRSAMSAPASRVQLEAGAVAMPLFLGSLTGIAAVVGAGGALAATIAGAILGGVAGAGLGGLLAGAVAQYHAAHIAAQLRQGGMVLWVGAPIRRRNSVRWRCYGRPAGATCMRMASSFRVDRRRACLRAPMLVRFCTATPNRKPGKPPRPGRSQAMTDSIAPAPQALQPEAHPAMTGESHGLSSEEARARLDRYGENALVEAHTGVLAWLFSYVWGPNPWMIRIAAVLSAIARYWSDFAIIVTMLVLNAGVGFRQEYKADTAIQALKQRPVWQARVLRDGVWQDLPARLLVVGDLVPVRLGNIVPADIRLLAGAYLSVDQSALTGGSLPVEKHRGDDAYSGSTIRQGNTAWLGGTAGTVSHFQRAVLKIGNFRILCTPDLMALIRAVAAIPEARLLGSVSQRLAGLAPLPVTVVP